ncbi:MAG: hypothetical protein LC739_00555 [Actinobacteria bacterium]|nr:hypothetical protein [Actinomycetota bacterium]
MFDRQGALTAEEALAAWTEGPKPDELAAGCGGRSDRLSSRHVSGVIEREDTTLFMDFEHWEPMNISTSAANQVFMATLWGTAFSDPTIDWFWVSIRGTSCPVNTGEETHCFPMTRAQFMAFLRLR